jgi:hypothetical protein
MSIVDVATLIIACVAVLGVVITWLSNNRERAERQGSITTEITNIKSDLTEVKNSVTSPEYGLPAIQRELSGMKQNCAGITAGFGARIKALEGKGGRG